MKKMILALAALGVAAMFTACGGDSSSSGSGNLVSCDLKTSMSLGVLSVTSHMCGEGPSSSEHVAELKKDCVSIEEDGVSVKATIGSGCPGGAKKVCPEEEGSVYYYDDGADKMSCEDLAEE